MDYKFVIAFLIFFVCISFVIYGVYREWVSRSNYNKICDSCFIISEKVALEHIEALLMRARKKAQIGVYGEVSYGSFLKELDYFFEIRVSVLVKFQRHNFCSTFYFV